MNVLLLIWHKFIGIFSSSPRLKLVKQPDPAPVVESHDEDVPKWFAIAQGELGVKEISRGDNPRIVEYHAATSLEATDDETPWCASFVSWCLEKSGVVSARSAWARSYLNWGVKLDGPKRFCVVVFRRGTDSGHVAFLNRDVDSNYVEVLGGNQANSVCYERYRKDDVLGYRWPPSPKT